MVFLLKKGHQRNTTDLRKKRTIRISPILFVFFCHRIPHCLLGHHRRWQIGKIFETISRPSNRLAAVNKFGKRWKNCWIMWRWHICYRNTPQKTNGWNLKIRTFEKEKSSEPKLHFCCFHVRFRGCRRNQKIDLFYWLQIHWKYLLIHWDSQFS